MELTCARCATTFTRRGPGPVPRYCSDACRYPSKVAKTLTCEKCGQDFERLDARGKKPRFCPSCHPRPKKATPPPPPLVTSCARCGEEIVRHRRGGTPPKFCGQLCRDRDQVDRWRADGRWDEYNAGRRGPGSACVDCAAPLRTGAIRCSACQGQRPYIPDAVRLAVYERDGWECQLCGLPAPRESRFPDPWCATLDHVVPVSLGGTDDEDNFQLAHFICNCRKQDRLDYVG